MDNLIWAVYQRAMPGESICGDAYLVQQRDLAGLVTLIDGLGHGSEAAYAANRTIEYLQSEEMFKLIAAGNGISCIQLLHKNLKPTRGIVLGLAFIDFTSNRLTYWGIGNIRARIYNQNTLNLISSAGVVGFKLPKLIHQEFPFYPGDYLLMQTDGILETWEWMDYSQDNYPTPSQISTYLGERFASPNDDATVLVVKREK